MNHRFEFQVTPEFNRYRLDEFLYVKFPHLGRMYLRELVRDGKCEVNGENRNRGRVLKTDDFVEVEVDRADRTSLHPENIGIDVLFEDADILVVDKPSGMLIHPTVRVRTGTLLNAVAHHLNPSERAEFRRAGLVHRLDKDTSGIVILAKNLRSHRILARHFQQKKVEKRYFAIVAGTPAADAGDVEAPIGRFAEQRLWAIKEDGKPAHTRFWVRERGAVAALLELEPVTGRTNQLRIHLAHIGHPIVGDVKYGGPEFSRLCLHAARIRINHPTTGVGVGFASPVPAEMEFSNVCV